MILVKFRQIIYCLHMQNMEDLEGKGSDGRHRPNAPLDTCSSFCTFVIVMTLHIAICDIVKDIIKGQCTYLSHMRKCL